MILETTCWLIRTDLKEMEIAQEGDRCPFIFDTDQVSNIRAVLDEDGIPDKTSVVELKSGSQIEVDVPYFKLVKIVWGDKVVKVEDC